MLGIVGESGSGKSTLMQSLYFDLIPTEGKAYLQNYGEGKKNIWDASPLEKRKIRNNIMGMVYQNPVEGCGWTILPHLTLRKKSSLPAAETQGKLQPEA